MPGHDHVTVLIGTIKAYVKGFNCISYSMFYINSNVCGFIYNDFAFLESKIHIV